MTKEEMIEQYMMYKREYYADMPTVTDEVFDDFEKELFSILTEEEKEEVRSVGYDILMGEKHLTPMLSLDNIFSPYDLPKTFTYPLLADLKMDGLSLNLIYDDGKLIQALTRGNGTIGESIMDKVQYIENVPKIIPYKKIIEIRGEIVMMIDEFKRLTLSGANLKDPRNAATGAINSNGTEIIKNRKLTFMPFGLGRNDLDFTKHSEVLSYIIAMGFVLHEYHRILNSNDEVYKYYNEAVKHRSDIEFQIDGVVLTIDDIAKMTSLGKTKHHPKGTIALKMPNEIKVTKLLDVIYDVSRYGQLTPVAIFKKTKLRGADVTNATLHNNDHIEKLDICINDLINITRSGDVIPKVVSLNKKAKNRKKITPPERCPSCDTKTNADGDFTYCPNELCSGRAIKQLEHYCSKDAMDIKDLSGKTLEKLYLYTNVTTPLDLYGLTKDDLLSIDGIKDKTADNILKNINDSIGKSFDKMLYGLSIPHLGRSVTRELVAEFGKKILTINPDTLKNLKGYGIVKSINIPLEIIKRGKLIDDLMKVVKPKIKINKIGDAVITGSFDKPRSEIANQLEELGYSVKSSISSKTDLLVIGDKPTQHKVEKAKKLKIPIKKEEELWLS